MLWKEAFHLRPLRRSFLFGGRCTERQFAKLFRVLVVRLLPAKRSKGTATNLPRLARIRRDRFVRMKDQIELDSALSLGRRKRCSGLKSCWHRPREKEGGNRSRYSSFTLWLEAERLAAALSILPVPHRVAQVPIKGFTQPMVSEANYLTPNGAQKIQDELRHLAGTERPKVVREVSDAAAQGDRSENAEYIYGKKRLREIDRRIRFLTKRLDCAVLVDPGTVNCEEVRFGATVVVRDGDDVERTYTLVGPDESEPSAGRVSFKSPIGRALMKKRKGDVVVAHRPAGEIELEIISVSYL